MSLGTVMEAAVRAHVGVTQDALVVPDDVEITTYEEVREVFGTNAEIAEAAGYGAPGQYRKGSAEWRRRRTFMRNLQRYEVGEGRAPAGGRQSRTPSRLLPRLVTVARINAHRANTPQTVGDVIRLMGMKGTTTSFISVKFQYSSPKNPARRRELRAKVYTWPDTYREVGWPMRGRVPRSEAEWTNLGDLYLEAFAIAYGMSGELVANGVDGDPVFIFTIGREEGIQYDFN